jgi:hypothetical protein
MQFTQSIKGCPSAQASQAGVNILYQDFSHQNVYEYIGLMFMHTLALCLCIHALGLCYAMDK